MVISKIRRILGRPYYESPNCILYNFDCLDAMKRIYMPFVQLTVTSPPYNIGKEYEKIRPLQEYLSWCEDWITEVLLKILRGNSDANISFSEFRQLLINLEFSERIRGDHHIFTKEGSKRF